MIAAPTVGGLSTEATNSGVSPPRARWPSAIGWPLFPVPLARPRACRVDFVWFESKNRSDPLQLRAQTSRTTRGVHVVSEDTIEVASFEERLALLLLTTACGNRALIDEAIQAVADEGESTLENVLDYIEQNRSRP